jgi:DegV family protein with EDD domain
MQIVTDRGMDLTQDQIKNSNLHFAPLRFTLDGKTYSSGVDIQPDEFYNLLEKTDGYPTTSQPSSGEFAEIYRELAKTDPEILSLHISSGLSGTINAARLGAEMVPEAHVTFVDSLTLSCPMGWQVEAAAKGIKAGWSMEKIVAKLVEIRAGTEGLFTLATLKYLIHGGRISHIKGLLASVLNIKPIIGVEKEHGKYVQYGQAFTLQKSIIKMVEKLKSWYPEGSHLRVQPLHGKNPEAAASMVEELKRHYKILLEPLTAIAPVLGAHTGPSIVGMAVAPVELFAGL